MNNVKNFSLGYEYQFCLPNVHITSSTELLLLLLLLLFIILFYSFGERSVR